MRKEEENMKILIPVYKTGNWSEEPDYVECSLRTPKELGIPEGVKLGWDSHEIKVDLFGINLN